MCLCLCTNVFLPVSVNSCVFVTWRHFFSVCRCLCLFTSACVYGCVSGSFLIQDRWLDKCWPSLSAFTFFIWVQLFGLLPFHVSFFTLLQPSCSTIGPHKSTIIVYRTSPSNDQHRLWIIYLHPLWSVGPALPISRCGPISPVFPTLWEFLFRFQ